MDFIYTLIDFILLQRNWAKRNSKVAAFPGGMERFHRIVKWSHGVNMIPYSAGHLSGNSPSLKSFLGLCFCFCEPVERERQRKPWNEQQWNESLFCFSFIPWTDIHKSELCFCLHKIIPLPWEEKSKLTLMKTFIWWEQSAVGNATWPSFSLSLFFFLGSCVARGVTD